MYSPSQAQVFDLPTSDLTTPLKRFCSSVSFTPDSMRAVPGRSSQVSVLFVKSEVSVQQTHRVPSPRVHLLQTG